jgi:hypothetical protein
MFNRLPFSITIPRVNALKWGTGVETVLTDDWRLRADFRGWITESINITVPDYNGAPVRLIVKGRGHTGRLADGEDDAASTQ